ATGHAVGPLLVRAVLGVERLAASAGLTSVLQRWAAVFGRRWMSDASAGRRCRPIVWGVIVVPILAGLLAGLLVADRVAVIHAQDRVAARLEGRGFPAKPRVTIAGFPFLAQLAARRMKKVVISGVGKKLGPVEVKRLDVTVHGMRVSSSQHGRTASRLSGTALVGFAGLEGGSGTPGCTFLQDRPDLVEISTSARAWWSVPYAGL